MSPIRAVAFAPGNKECISVAADGTVRRWPVPVPFAEPDLECLAQRVALMTGQRIDDNTGLNDIPPTEWRELRTRLVGTASTALVGARSDEEWHDKIATDAEQDGDVTGAEWHLDRLARLRAQDWTIAARRGRLLATAGKLNAAATAYAAAAQLAPSHQVLSDWLRVQGANEEALGRMDKALWNLDKAVALTPDDWTLYAARAGLAFKTGQGDRMAKDVDEMIRRGGDDIGTIVQVAESLGALGDWKRAAVLLNRLANVPNQTPDNRTRIAIACLRSGDVAGYRAVCAATVDPLAWPNVKHYDAYRAALLFALGANATDNWPKPLAWIDHALARLTEIEKEKPTAKDQVTRLRKTYLSTRGTLLYRAGRFAEAAKVLKEAISLHTSEAEFRDWLILALAENQLGDQQAAKTAAVNARAARNKTPRDVWTLAEVELLVAELDAIQPLH